MNTLTEGKYVIDLKTLRKDSDEMSVMGNYLAGSAIITKAADFLTVTLLILDNQTVLGFQLEGNNGWEEADEHRIDDETNRRYELFDLVALTGIINARVQYEYPHEGRTIKADEEFRIAFDHDSIESV